MPLIPAPSRAWGADHDGDERRVGNTAHMARPTHQSAQASAHQPWTIADALPSTLVAATAVRKAKPLAWLVRSAMSSR